jgi:hypothetical protein
MLLDRKSEIESLIREKYSNKEINVIEKEMAINILLECCYANKLEEDEIRWVKVLSEQSTEHIVDWIIGFGRDEHNSHDIPKCNTKEEIEILLDAILIQREKYSYV